MDKSWSDMNREMQSLLSKKGTFREGIEKLFALRDSLFGQITQIMNNFPEEAFSQMPFAGAVGYHCKTLAYSVWHIFRIEDIVAHEMIAEDRQVLFAQGFAESVGSPLITTGNELCGDEIAAFSAQLNIPELYRYARAVKQSTEQILTRLEPAGLKRRFGDETAEKLRRTGCVSDAESAAWLIEYWCGKDVAGLIRMPFSRHWIMHVEAMRRIKNELCRKARKGTDPVAYCGLSCDHCFLKDWCGGCRTAYNVCSYATCSPDRICPNAACCREKGLDGCYGCAELAGCRKGFYANGRDVNAIKAMALYIRGHGKKELSAVMGRLHRKFDFQKIQEILGDDVDEGLRILEEN